MYLCLVGFIGTTRFLAKYRKVLKCLPHIPNEILLKGSASVFKSWGMTGCTLWRNWPTFTKAKIQALQKQIKDVICCTQTFLLTGRVALLLKELSIWLTEKPLPKFSPSLSQNSCREVIYMLFSTVCITDLSICQRSCIKVPLQSGASKN